MKKKYLYIVALLFLLVSCNDYLDIKPKGQRIPGTVEDYDLLLAPVTDLYIEHELFLSADDFSAEETNLGDLTNPDNKKLHFYTYSDKRNANPDISAYTWNYPYKNLYVYNKVISEIDEARGAIGYKEEDKKRIKAEALYGRAGQYFFLVNMFAKHYNSATANSDKAVPLVLVASTSQKTPARATVEEVYSLIIKDLTEAMPNLPKLRKAINRPSKGSGYALLSRVYLYQGRYELALKNAELALKENAELSDYTKATPRELMQSYETEQYSVLYYGYMRGFVDGILSKEMKDLYDTKKDIRATTILGCKWVRGDKGWTRDCSKMANSYAINPNLLPSIAEMYVTAAECYARAGDTAQALEKLNKLRKHRIKNVVAKTVADFTSSEAVLLFALEERRREMLMSGMRLFDLKRLNLDPKFAKTVKHTVKDKVYEAAPNSGKLVFPIPAQVKKFNTSF